METDIYEQFQKAFKVSESRPCAWH